jgi:thiamine biosynthesis lipoprotein
MVKITRRSDGRLNCESHGADDADMSIPGRLLARRASPLALAVAIGAAAWTGARPPCVLPSAAADTLRSSAPRLVTYSGRTMGTFANVTLVTADSAGLAPLAARAHAVFHRVDSLMSNWTATSEVARVNREASDRATTVSPDVAAVIDSSLDVWRESDGAFDITVEPLVRLWGFLGGPKRVPAREEVRAALEKVGAGHVRLDRAASTVRFDRPGVRIDLGGIAKGYAVERAGELLAGEGVTDALVNVTGNMVAIGHPPGSSAWRIGIRDPRDRVPYFAHVPITNEGISTSGQYEQFFAADGRAYGHILDPHDGYPVDGLISVTVISKSAFLCDTWDTPLFVMGLEKAKRKAKERPDLAVVLVEPGANGVDTVWVERSLENRFVLEPSAAALFRVVYF